MTEGTSQGLFIVVALVIFGIFVSLSYTLFGKTLQPQMVSLFETAIEKVNDNSNGVFERQLIDLDSISLDTTLPYEQTKITLDKNMLSKVLTVDSKGNGHGLNIPTKEISKVGTKYILSFKMKLLSGKVDNIGGHIGAKEGVLGAGVKDVSVKINGAKKIPITVLNKNNDWFLGVPTPTDYKIGDTITVDVSYTRDFFTDKDYFDAPIKIQPNRNANDAGFGYGNSYKVEFSRMSLLELE